MVSAVVLVVDGLSANYLGPYGNTWLETQQLNRLAAEALLLDNAITDSADLLAVYRSYWNGRPWWLPESARTAPGMLAQLRERQVRTVFLTDEPTLARDTSADAFDERVVLDVPALAESCDEIEQTQLAQLFATAMETWSGLRPPFLLWIHARGLYGPWDAPYALREQFVELSEGDPPPPTFVAPPHRKLPADVDPDELLGISRAYAAQVQALDFCCGAFLDAIRPVLESGETLLVLTSPRGYPLGEHARVGLFDDGLYGELVHVPLVIRHPRGCGAATRDFGFVQPADICSTLLAWWGQPAGTGTGLDLLPTLLAGGPIARQYAVSRCGTELAVRTRGWFGRLPAGRPLELYVKPDDRFEANDVATRCPDVAAELATVLGAWPTLDGEAGRARTAEDRK